MQAPKKYVDAVAQKLHTFDLFNELILSGCELFRDQATLFEKRNMTRNF